jgi:ketopantoate reductase
MKICVFGAGAIGGYFAAERALAGQHPNETAAAGATARQTPFRP